MSQTELILKHLMQRPITPIAALNKYGCLRLAARVKDLRNKGYNIITTSKGKKKVAEYSMGGV